MGQVVNSFSYINQVFFHPGCYHFRQVVNFFQRSCLMGLLFEQVSHWRALRVGLSGLAVSHVSEPFLLSSDEMSFLTAARLFLNYFASFFSSSFSFISSRFTFCSNSLIFVHNLLVELTLCWSGPSGTTWEPWPAPTWPSWPSKSPWMTLLRQV